MVQSNVWVSTVTDIAAVVKRKLRFSVGLIRITSITSTKHIFSSIILTVIKFKTCVVTGV